jgi:hypothetical protein
MTVLDSGVTLTTTPVLELPALPPEPALPAVPAELPPALTPALPPALAPPVPETLPALPPLPALVSFPGAEHERTSSPKQPLIQRMFFNLHAACRIRCTL